MSAKSKARKAVKKTEVDLSKLGHDIAKGGKAVENELKKGGSDLKKDAKRIRKKI